ncbi:unnamed protein product [Dovyalis caffra]|uniref:Chalcone synthase n=1 Tax=Dovyalis caffra TaxID=77055 RepID=A0AAV1RJA5_9ROSI|nr:unnamed protein product [Dovyalis caffra]
MASILAIGTANPPNCFYQADYPDFYFRVTKSEDLTQLKDKFKLICEKSEIRKRYMYLSEEIIKKNPTIGAYDTPSLDARQEILVTEVPKLGKEAALKAIEEWGQPKSKITHLIFCTSSGMHMPGADHELTKLLGLQTSVKRFMMYQQGCYAAAQALRLSKDLAENNPGARVLVVCSENMTFCFRAPSETHLDVLVGSAIFSDGAAAVIVGADPDTTIERPLYQLVSAEQCIVPNSEDAIVCPVREIGMSYSLNRSVPKIVAKGAAQCLVETFGARYGIEDWNSLFYVVHPGGAGVLNKLEEQLGLTKDKLRATRHVLTEYGNMWSPNVLFTLDEMRRRSAKEGKATTGEGLDLGVLFGFGPGVTIETIVLRSFPTG